MQLVLGAAYTGVLFYGVAAVSAVIAAVHLVGCHIDSYVLRYATKPALMPSLILLHMVMCGTAHPFIIIGLAFGCLGDIFLMLAHRGKLFFLLGMGAFLLGHASYITAAHSAGLPQRAIAAPGGTLKLVIVGAVMLIGCAAAYAYLYNSIFKKLRVPTAAYITALGAMAFTMVFSFVGRPLLGTGYAAVGSVLFLTSDFLLACRMFGKTKRRSSTMNFAVMATYIIAQLCIAMGFASL